jgi:hypothetical protein
MASYTSNLNLKKPALTDDALVTDLNDNSDKLDAAISAGSGAIAIVSVGNTHAAISSGQYVYVRQHGSLSEGLYKATTNIAANGTLSGSNLTAVSGGGLNSVYSALSDKMANYDPTKKDAYTGDFDDLPSGMFYVNTTTHAPATSSYYFVISMVYSTHAAQIAISRGGTWGMYVRKKSTGEWSEWKTVQMA